MKSRFQGANEQFGWPGGQTGSGSPLVKEAVDKLAASTKIVAAISRPFRVAQLLEWICVVECVHNELAKSGQENSAVSRNRNKAIPAFPF